jgi:hypothetical protein
MFVQRGYMSVTWTVLHPERLVIVTGRDEVTPADLLFCIDEMTKAGVNPYRKIYDMTLIARSMSLADLQLLGKRMATIADGQRLGPVAIVVASNGIAGSARHFEDTSGARRPARIFRELYAARAWLDEMAPPDHVAETGRG